MNQILLVTYLVLVLLEFVSNPNKRLMPVLPAIELAMLVISETIIWLFRHNIERIFIWFIIIQNKLQISELYLNIMRLKLFIAGKWGFVSWLKWVHIIRRVAARHFNGCHIKKLSLNLSHRNEKKSTKNAQHKNNWITIKPFHLIHFAFFGFFSRFVPFVLL